MLLSSAAVVDADADVKKKKEEVLFVGKEVVVELQEVCCLAKVAEGVGSPIAN